MAGFPKYSHPTMNKEFRCLKIVSIYTPVGTMVLIRDGNSQIGAHIRSNLCYLICLRHFIRSRQIGYLVSEQTFWLPPKVSIMVVTFSSRMAWRGMMPSFSRNIFFAMDCASRLSFWFAQHWLICLLTLIT